MMTFQLMTLGGIYASPVVARDADDAAAQAEARGHEVLDVMDDIVVIAD